MRKRISRDGGVDWFQRKVAELGAELRKLPPARLACFCDDALKDAALGERPPGMSGGSASQPPAAARKGPCL
jgi:hypothetical protein